MLLTNLINLFHWFCPFIAIIIIKVALRTVKVIIRVEAIKMLEMRLAIEMLVMD